MDLSPDLGAAILQYLKDSADLTSGSVVGTRIYLGWPERDDRIEAPTSESNFLNVLIIESKKGGPGDVGGGLVEDRVTFKCYGKNKLTASNIWRVLNYYLMKPDGRTKTSFTKASTRVLTIFQEGGPLELSDPSAAGWPFVECSYIFRYSGLKVPV